MSLFEFEEDEPLWKKEWRNMPDFHQEDLKPFRRLRVYFRCEEDVQEFAKIVEQKLTDKTLSIHYPYKPVQVTKHLHWVSDL